MTNAIRIRNHPAVSFLMPFSSRELTDILRSMLYAAGHPEGGLELAILDDAAMQVLHMESLGLPGPTNILSFPAAESSQPQLGAMPLPFLGWMALSAPTLLRECFLYGQNEHEHCLRLLAHGLAHVLGHDHGLAMDKACARLEQAAAHMLPA